MPTEKIESELPQGGVIETEGPFERDPNYPCPDEEGWVYFRTMDGQQTICFHNSELDKYGFPIDVLNQRRGGMFYFFHKVREGSGNNYLAITCQYQRFTYLVMPPEWQAILDKGSGS